MDTCVLVSWLGQAGVLLIVLVGITATRWRWHQFQVLDRYSATRADRGNAWCSDFYIKEIVNEARLVVRRIERGLIIDQANKYRHDELAHHNTGGYVFRAESDGYLGQQLFSWEQDISMRAWVGATTARLSAEFLQFRSYITTVDSCKQLWPQFNADSNRVAYIPNVKQKSYMPTSFIKDQRCKSRNVDGQPWSRLFSERALSNLRLSVNRAERLQSDASRGGSEQRERPTRPSGGREGIPKIPLLRIVSGVVGLGSGGRLAYLGGYRPKRYGGWAWTCLSGLLMFAGVVCLMDLGGFWP